MIPRPTEPIVAALDVSTLEEADRLAEILAPHVGMLKVGLELAWSAGPEAIRRVAARGPVFADCKLHDIPNTVERAAANVARLGVAMLNVHALGGEAMMRAGVAGARRGAADAGVEPPLVVAVTVLSSHAGEGLASPASLAFEAKAAGLDGVVVSGEDVEDVRAACGEEFCLVVPGIRPRGIQRTRPGPGPHARRSDRAGRRLPGDRSPGDGSSRPCGRRQGDHARSPLTVAAPGKPQATCETSLATPTRAVHILAPSHRPTRPSIVAWPSIEADDHGQRRRPRRRPPNRRSMGMALPTLTPEQRAQALAKAAEARKKRAELKGELKSGKRTLGDVLIRSTEDTVGKMKVSAVLESLPGVGKVRAQKLMEELDISASRRVRGLGAKQRAQLLDRFKK